MVRRAVVQEPEIPVQRVVPKRNWEAEHREYWDHIRHEHEDHFLAEMGGLHVQDGFRIVCDGLVDGEECLNVIGYAPPPEDHDGLCQRCRRERRPFATPRIHLTPDRVVWDHHDLEIWRKSPKPWLRSAPTPVDPPTQGDAFEDPA